ncbi:MAG: hypothetical protein KBD56_03505 [Candidatus Eisenbacteria bacterium]|nr:hypothetical protein [Candidatus Eisenbacteria bacterium]
MKRINVAIEGTSPLICNRFTDAAQIAATNGSRLASVGEKGTPAEQAEARLYVGHDGKPMIPQPNLFRCLIDAGQFFRSGRTKVSTVKSSLLPACAEVEGLEIPIQHKDPWTVDTRAVRIPSTGGRILCHRPCFNDWRLGFTLSVDEELITLRLMREIVDAAGKRIGLGDFRPSCKGPFGKFVVVQWQEQ